MDRQTDRTMDAMTDMQTGSYADKRMDRCTDNRYRQIDNLTDKQEAHSHVSKHSFHNNVPPPCF